MRFDTVLFDLDGTLTDSALGITNAIAYALEACKMDVPPRQELYRFVGPPLIEEFQKVFGVDRAFAEHMVKQFQVYFADKGLYENSVYEGVPAMLRRLQEAGCRLILATSKPEVFAERIMDNFDLRKYFTLIAGSEISETRTDKAEVIAYALDKVGDVDISRAIMVGDRSHDVFGARKNNLSVMGVLYGYGSYEELNSAGADLLAKTVMDVAEIIINS